MLTREAERKMLGVKRRFKKQYSEGVWVRFYCLSFVRGFSAREVSLALKMTRKATRYWRKEVLSCWI